MFKKKTDSINYGKLNEGIAIGVSLLKIIFILTIVVLIFICSRLLEDWKILSSIGNILSVISPLFIGIGLAWLFDPFVSYLNKKGVSRILGAIFVYIIFLSLHFTKYVAFHEWQSMFNVEATDWQYITSPTPNCSWAVGDF